MSSRSILLITALLGSLALAGCGKKSAAPVAPAAVEVDVVTISTAPVALTRELPGRTAARRIAEVRARVNGIILARHFTEGADVKKGDLLYEIDPAPYASALASAQAGLARAEASLVSVKLQTERFKSLVATNAVSKQQYDDAVAAVGIGEAEVASAKAAVLTADINLGYTRVVSPINGRTGMAEVTEGAYVQASAATLLATVQQIDPIYVNLVQPAAEATRIKLEAESGRLTQPEDSQTPITVIMEGGIEYPLKGHLEFSDISVDKNTGTVTLRALFPNPNGVLLPGTFVRARYETGVIPKALLAPQQGITRNYRGEPTAYVVSPQGTAELRVLKTGSTYGDQWVIESGLMPGDQVIVTNLKRIRPGSPVKAVPFQPAAALPAAASH
ncbi:MAG: efflux RND transporter periplasmic adaptor subunit [Opitutaceae bacterium]|jgi:membrane fusion protein (multidrug efflux system)